MNDYPIPLAELFPDHLAQTSLHVRVFGSVDDPAGGNKSFKLSRFLDLNKAHLPVLSFGGAYSNHLLALSAKGKQENFKTIGIIRGEEPQQRSPYLLAMQRNGMHLEFISREAYRTKETPEFLTKLRSQFGDCCIIPEGGAGQLGILGASAMVQAHEPYDWVVLPGATGTTLAGVAQKLNESLTRVACIQVLKGENIIRHELLRTSQIDVLTFQHVRVFEQYHFGGYAKSTTELRVFQEDWIRKTGIPLDLVYGAKAMFGLLDLIQNSQEIGGRILYLHTGGLGPNPELCG